jgi:ferredoxin
MICVYFSGTGNTRHLSEKLSNFLNCSAVSIEKKTAVEKISENDTIIFAYPVYVSDSPKIIREFLNNSKINWKNKKVFLLVTCGMQKGKAIANVANILRKNGAEILGGEAFKMPESIGDFPLFTLIMPPKKNAKVIKKAEIKLEILAEKIKQNQYPQTGLNSSLNSSPKPQKKSSAKVKIDKTKCINCGLCKKNCPYGDNFGDSNNKCTLCYRCYANCPKQAITIFGKKPVYQYNFPNAEFVKK